MIKLYEESELKRLTTSEIDRMKDDTVLLRRLFMRSDGPRQIRKKNQNGTIKEAEKEDP